MNGKHFWLCLSVVLALSAGTVIGGVVGVDVQGAVYTGPGVLDTTSRTWTSRTGNSTFDLDGQTVNLIFGGFTGTGTISSAAIDLFDHYKYTTNAGGVGVVLTNLDPAKTYNVVYYGLQNAYGNPGRGTTFDLVEPDLAPKTTNGDNHSTFVEGDNYARWDGLTPAGPDNRIRVLVKPGPAPNTNIGFINGFEIETVGGSPPPPPPPPVNSVLQYGFDFTSGTVASNGATVNDDSGKGNHGVVIQGNGGSYSADIPTAMVQNATGVGSLDVTGAAISSANSLGVGSGQGIITAADVFNAGGLTMEVWVKDVSAPSGVQGIPGLALNMGGMYVLGVASNGQVGFFRGDNSNDQSWTTAQDTSAWTHLAVVMETTDPNAMSYDTITAYVNGSPIHSGSHAFPWFLSRATSVGNHQYNVGWGPMDGLVYEPRISLGAIDPRQFTYGTGPEGDIPEPATLAMLAMATAAVGGYVRKRRRGILGRRIMMKATKTIAAFLAVGLFLALAGTASAEIVGVDSAGAVYTGAGVLDTTSRTWSGSSFTLDGNTVTVDYGGAANLPHRGGGAPTLFEQMRYKGDGSVTFDVTLSNLNTGNTYDLVVYGVDRWAGAGPRGSKYEVLGSGLGAKETDYLATSASFIEDENYVRFNGLSASTGTITFRVSEGTVGNKISMLNGFEIETVSTGPPPPPPPANSILQYGFDFTSGTVASNGPPVNDDSGSGNHGIILQGNGGTYSADIPTAMVQNATGVGSLGTSNGNWIATAGDIVTYADIMADGGLTLEAWVKGGGSGPIVSIEGVYSLTSTAGGGAFVDGFDNNNRRVDGTFDRSEWHHMAGVLSNPSLSGSSLYGDMTLYVDGLPVGTRSHVLFNADLNRAAAIGNHPLTGINEPFTGLVYEPRISLGALDPRQFTYGTGPEGDIPEPATLALLGLAVTGLGGYVRRRRRT